MKNTILEILENQSPISSQKLMELLKISSSEERVEFFNTVASLELDGIVSLTKKNKLMLVDNSSFLKGTFQSAGINGSGFVTNELGEKLFIQNNHVNTALPGDIVLAAKTKNDEGEIRKILKRFEGEYVGTVVRFDKKSYSFIPERGKFCFDVSILIKNSLNARPMDKVKIKVISEPKGNLFYGQVTKVYGKKNTLEANYEAILDEYEIEREFDEDVILEAQIKSSGHILKNEYSTRENLCDSLIFTIDGADAKDLDDAVSLKVTENGYVLGVHIADVSEYVTHGSKLDACAYARGTSVYFADQVVPMLPKEISNNVCSLNENGDKLALSCEMTLDKEANVIDTRIFKSIIRSKKHGIYSQINDLLNGQSDEGYEHIKPVLFEMKALSDKLTEKRMQRGGIDFETTESKILFDENGEITDIVKRERGQSERMIENFMLLANESVAKYMFYMYVPFIYRVHEEPSSDKATAFLTTAKQLGYPVRGKNMQLHQKTLQDIINYFEPTNFSLIIQSLALRSLMKAKYSENCLGHYGLCLKHYCHFTSPIRRYPDLVCHRIIKELIDTNNQQKIINKYSDFCIIAANSSSKSEVRAMQAERDIEDLYKTIYISTKKGNEYDGVVSGVSSFGMWVMLENTVEGLVRLSSMDDYYEFDSARLTLSGQRKKCTFSIGDKVRIKVIGADIATAKIDFELVRKY